MASPVTLASQIWMSDIDDQESTARGAAQIQNDYIQRLFYQRAPADLVNEMIAVRTLFEEAMDRLNKVKKCFPLEPSGS